MRECEALEAMLKDIDDNQPGSPSHRMLYEQTARAVVELFHEHKRHSHISPELKNAVDGSLNACGYGKRVSYGPAGA